MQENSMPTFLGKSLQEWIRALADVDETIRACAAYNRGHQTKKFLTRMAAAEKLHPYLCSCDPDRRDEGVWRVTRTRGFDYGSQVSQ